MKKSDIEDIIKTWRREILIGDIQDYSLEIDEEVPEEHAAIALHLDYSTVRATGEGQDFYEGYEAAAKEVLKLLSIELLQDDQRKVVMVRKKEETKEVEERLERLKDYIW